MKHVWYLLLFSLSLLGCKKDPPPPALSPNAELLTAHVWLYNEYYSAYGTPAQKRMYKRGAAGNVVDFSDYRYVFKKDGKFELVMKRETVVGTWKFVNSEQAVEISFSGATPSRLQVAALAPGSFDWGQDGYFARMIPQ